MSFYQRKTRRWPLVLASFSVALVIGFIGGWLCGDASAPSLTEQIKSVNKQADDLAARVGVIETEYPQAVRDGRIVGSVEYKGVQSRIADAKKSLEGLDDTLGLINPFRMISSRKALQQLASAVNAKASAQEVGALVTQFQHALRESTVY